MAHKIFVDTGAFFARFYRRDQYHNDAVSIWNHLESESVDLITTGYVLAEFTSLLARRTSHEYTSQILPLVYNPGIFNIENVIEADEQRAIKLFAKYADQNIGFVDCLSFSVMERLKIGQAFTFDKKHFGFAGFEILSPPYF